MAIVLFALSRLFTSVWLQIWIDQGDGVTRERNSTESNLTLTEDQFKGYITDHPDLWFYQMIYGLSLPIMIFFGIVKGYGIAFLLLRGAGNLHNKMLVRLIKAPMSFFDEVPAGRIINRFSKDIDESESEKFDL